MFIKDNKYGKSDKTSLPVWYLTNRKGNNSRNLSRWKGIIGRGGMEVPCWVGLG